MDQIPKHMKRALRQLADRAYEIELGRELTELEGEFARWHRGEVSPFEVAEVIHRFHQGPARDLYVSYTSRHPKAAIAHAIQNGILDRTQIAPAVLAE
jgi:hypothetical protein